MKNMVDIKELSDSRELLEKKPPHFIIGFIYIFLALLIALIIWSFFGQKEVVVNAQGIVQAVNSNNIIPLVNGKIQEVKVNEGDFVKVGDVLITLDDESVVLENKTIEEKIIDTSGKRELLKKYETSIVQNSNLFSQNDDEKEYYYKYLNFQNQLNLNNNTQSQETIKTEGYESAIENNNQESSALQSQISSLEDENNRLLTNMSEMTDTSAKYEDQITTIKNNINLVENQSSLDIQEIQEKLDKVNSEISINESQISQNQQMIQTYKSQLKSYQANIDNSQQSISISNSISKRYDIESDKYIDNELSQTQAQIKEQEDQLKEYTSQLKKSEIELQNYVIKAQLNGYIHFISPLNKNDMLQAGTEIIKINGNETNQLKIELYIPSKEISNIAVDQTVKIHSYSLPYQEYGFIESKVNSLDIDSSMTQDNSGSYYKAEILIDDKTLKGNNGKEADLKIGMPIEGQIITEQKSYLQLFLEKLELWING
ncbi:HlyD family efflux transporter periplasmic adaptor subunit [Acetobacterium tundrae]|uniref:HlyD family efflux transporter periplasmic adaptor subunit n=1 Tax=Acetobacterium tundrae TaxID=132932 RepID=A0ABR6WPI3_9FIRM|nr:HlyD family efflux transporter periplasmic adaptor subunit [Acetobacterium tundrae]MBC3798208.1 HlyD family efflux transporter periplasmic adaptor subunit [Acetobacterium tundrae]